MQAPVENGHRSRLDEAFIGAQCGLSTHCMGVERWKSTETGLSSRRRATLGRRRGDHPIIENRGKLSDINITPIVKGYSMPTTFLYLMIGLMLAGLLLRKTWAMAQKGSEIRSHQLMWFRVMAQFLAVAALVIFVYFTR